MQNQKKNFTVFLIVIIIILFGVFQYTIFLKKQNDLLMVNVESIKKQIVSFESRNNSERWNARITELTRDNKELKNKIAMLEAILAQEAAKPDPGKAKETPKGNRGFLLKKR